MANGWFRPYHESDGIAIYHVDLAPDAVHEARAVSWLDDAERLRFAQFRFSRPRWEFALCRAALRAILCNLLGCTNGELAFGTLAYGKPFALVRSSVHPVSFNVSHSGSHGLVAVSQGGRLGVDVEDRTYRRDIEGVAEAVFGPNEQADLAMAEGYPKVCLFLRLWTQKEALIKAYGTGFSIDVSRFEICASMRHGARQGGFQFPQVPDVGWRLENVGCADFAAAVASECTVGQLPTIPSDLWKSTAPSRCDAPVVPVSAFQGTNSLREYITALTRNTGPSQALKAAGAFGSSRGVDSF